MNGELAYSSRGLVHYHGGEHGSIEEDTGESHILREREREREHRSKDSFQE